MKRFRYGRLHLRLSVLAVIFAVIHAMFLASVNTLKAQFEGEGVIPQDSNTGVRYLKFGQNTRGHLVVVSNRSLGSLMDLADSCSPDTVAPPLSILQLTLKASRHEGSFGLELGESPEEESCKARRLETDSTQRVDYSTVTVADARLVGTECREWKTQLAHLVGALRAPSEESSCNSVPAVQAAIQDLSLERSTTEPTTAGSVVEFELVSWKAELGGVQESLDRELALVTGTGNELVLRLRVHDGDTLSELSEYLTGRGTLEEARNTAAMSNISDIDVIQSGTSLYFASSRVRPEIWSQFYQRDLEAAGVRLPEKIAEGTYSIEEQLTWDTLSKGIWGQEYASGAPWLWTVNLDKDAYAVPSGEVDIPVEVGDWMELGGDSLSNWNGVDKEAQASGIVLSGQALKGLKRVFCESDESHCVLPTFRAIKFEGEVTGCGEGRESCD